jgi:CHAD domain-containing protein
MKARKVKGIDLDAPYGKGLKKTLALRLDELRSFAPAAADPRNVEELHDMRIAVKRVRYLLEIAGSGDGVTAAKQLQELLGEIHDCDELLPLVRAHVKRLRAEDAVAAASGEPLPNRRKYRGLEALRAHLAARRGQLHAEFRRRWPKLEDALLHAKVPA